MLNKILCAFLLVFSLTAAAEILLYKFDNPELELRFNKLSQELRCPKCQNNNLADSNAPLAVDLKDIIYEKLHLGETDEQIVSYLKERYGDFISYRPPVKPSTWFIWFGPFLFLAGGVIAIVMFLKKRGQTGEKISATMMSEKMEASADELLKQWESEVAENTNDSQVSKHDNSVKLDREH